MRLGHGSIFGLAVSDDAPYGKATRCGELEITLIVPGNSHHGPRTVGSDDEIAEPHRDALPRQWVNHVKAGEDAFLLLHLLDAVKLRKQRHLIAEFTPGGFLGAPSHQLSGHRMLRSHRQEGHAKQGVRTGRKDADFAKIILELEGDFRPFRATKPVLLKQGNVLWEIDGVQAVDQFLSVLG